MNKSDIQFTIGLDTSPAEKQLDLLYDKMRYPNVSTNRKDPFIQQISNENNQGLETSSSGVIVPPSNSLKTLNGYIESTLPAIQKSREVFQKMQYAYSQNYEALNGYRYAGSSNSWDNQKKLSYDSLPVAERAKEVYKNMQFDYTQEALKGYRYAGSSNSWDNQTEEKKQFLLNYDKVFGEKKEPKKKDIEYKKQPWHEKHMEEINKKDNIELKDKLLLWSKILATVYAIKKVISGLVKVWKFGADTVTSRNANINEESGFFTTDPIGAMRSNIDRTRPMLYAGIRNLGENAPVSKAGLDYTANKFTEMWTAAMSGRNVDARTTIDVQRLKDFFGIDLTVAGLLTGEREGKTATDVQLDAMKKIEQNLIKLNEADEVTKGQVIDSLKNVLGEEMINSIVANYNKNLKIDAQDLKITVAERLLEAGGSALSPQDLTEKTTMAVTALGDFKESLEILKNTITVTFAPAFVSVTETLTTFVDWLNRKMTKAEGPKDVTGGYKSNIGFESAKRRVWSTGASASNAGNVWGTSSERAQKANEALTKAKTAEDVINAIAYVNPLLKDEASIETPEIKRFAKWLTTDMASGELDPNSNNPFVRYFANYEYKGLKGANAIKKATKEGEFGNLADYKMLQQLLLDPSSFTIENYLPKNYSKLTGEKKQKAYDSAQNRLQQDLISAANQFIIVPFFQGQISTLFGEGGAYDFNPETMSYTDYKFNRNMYKNEEDFYEALRLFEESIKTNKWGREYIQSFNLPSKEELAGSNKKLDFGEVVFTVTLTDQAGKLLGSKELVGGIVDGVQ